MPKNLIFAAGLCFMVSAVRAEETVSFSSVSFKSVNYSIDSSFARLSFEDVYVIGNLVAVIKDVEVKIDAVSVELRKDLRKGDYIYTTLDIFNAPVDPFDGRWLKPEKVVVVVRDSHDLAMWNKFLSDVKKKQEKKRREALDPIRVFPPLIEN